MKRVVASVRFQKYVEGLSADDQQKVLKAIDVFRTAVHEGVSSKGLGLKKIARDKYEIRVDLKIRIGIMKDNDTFVLDLLGNHEDIRNFLKNY